MHIQVPVYYAGIILGIIGTRECSVIIGRVLWTISVCYLQWSTKIACDPILEKSSFSAHRKAV